MDTLQNQSNFGCEIQILSAKNISLKSEGRLFVRSYLSAGNNEKIRLNSREISTKTNLVWNELTSLDCSGTRASMGKLVQGTVIFEVRWRKENSSIFGRGSQLIGRAEIAWKTVFESPDMELKKWVVMISKNRRVYDEDCKPAMVQISLKLRTPVTVTKLEPEHHRRAVELSECGCGSYVCKSCIDYDVFVLGALDCF